MNREIHEKGMAMRNQFLPRDTVSDLDSFFFSDFELRVSFGFRASDFGFIEEVLASPQMEIAVSVACI